MGLVSLGARKVEDIRSFLREAASGAGIKYVPEKGTRHLIYVPYSTETVVDEESGTERVVKMPVAISGQVHEWKGSDGKFKACICLKDIMRKAEDGSVLNDGTCPFCDRVSDAWEIYRYRKELEEAKCQLTGDAKKKHMEKVVSSLADERKAKAAVYYLYMLVVKFRTDAAGNPVMGSDGVPEYDLKVMKLSQSRVDKVQQQLQNSGISFEGSEIVFEYPNTDDKRLVVSQSTCAAVFPENYLTRRFPKLIEKINADVAKFEWDKIDKAFGEWAGMSTEAAKMQLDGMFEKWDAYQKELTVNPNAQYLEYVSDLNVTTPSIGAVPGAPVIPGAPAIPGAVPGVATGAVPGAVPGDPVIPGAVPNVAPGVAPAAAPNVGAPNIGPAPSLGEVPGAANPNAVFGGANGIQL